MAPGLLAWATNNSFDDWLLVLLLLLIIKLTEYPFPIRFYTCAESIPTAPVSTPFN